MYTNLRKVKLFIFIIITLLLSCSDTEDEGSKQILSDFMISPTNYYGKELTGLIKFNERVETPIWYSSSGMLKFDGVSTADSVTNDSVTIYYNDVPYVSKIETDSLGEETSIYGLREKDTVYVRFYHNHTEYISTKVIELKNFKPVIDSFTVENGNYIEFGSTRVASFLIGSGLGKIKCFSQDFEDDSVSIYWHSNSEDIADQTLMSYLPFEFDISPDEDNIMLYVDVINKNGAIKKDSINVTIYKERGSIWVLDESTNIIKFSSLGGAIAKIDSVDAVDLEFLENTNTLVVQSLSTINTYYTTGEMLNNSIAIDSTLATKLYKFDNDLYISFSSTGSSLLNKYDNVMNATTKISYSKNLTNFIKDKDRYVFSEIRNDSGFIHVSVADSVVHTEKDFLRIKQLDKYSRKGYILILDDILSKITVLDINADSVIGNITGFIGKPVAMSVNESTGILYVFDGASSLKSVDLNTISGDVVLPPSVVYSSVLASEVFDLPKYIDVNEYADTDGSGSVWICDTHNDRVVKLSSTGSLLAEIIGYFHLPQKLVINKGL